MTCNKLLADGQYWKFCGETDMGQTEPVRCTRCGGDLILAEDVNHPDVIKVLCKYKKDSFKLRKEKYLGKNHKWWPPENE